MACPETLSALMLQFIEANPEQLERDETSQQWVESMWRIRNPAAKLKIALNNFLEVFQDFDGVAAAELRAALEPLTK